MESPSPDASHTQLEFAHGVLSIVAALCANLIGRGVLDADDLRADVERRALIWREHNCPTRALPAEILAERLRSMAVEKREVDQRIAASRGAVRPRMEQ